jgi:hypothetical protein
LSAALREAAQSSTRRIRTLLAVSAQSQAVPYATLYNVYVFDLGSRRADGKPGSPIQLVFTGGFIV